MTAIDTKGLPRQYKAAALAINSNKPSGDLKTKKQVICHLCGKPGHIKPNCPLLKSVKSMSKSSEEANGKKNNGDQDKKSKPWRFIAPNEGESETIVRNEKTFHWCAKCGRWTTTHCTATHVGKKNDKSKRSKNKNSKLEANLGKL